MYNLDDLVIEFNDQVPWLLLLNLLVMFLIVLLYCSTFFALDITNKGVEVEVGSEFKFQSRYNSSNPTISRICSQHNKVNRAIIKDNATSSTARRSEREVDGNQAENLPSRDVAQPTLCYYSYSAWRHWLKLASNAFLSCLGLHSTSINKVRKERNDDH